MKKLFFLVPFFLLSFSAVSQLDSVSVNAHFEMVNIQTEGGDSLTVKIIRAETWINDFDFFGEIIVTAYDEVSGFPVDKVKHTVQSITENELYNSGIITVDLYRGLEEGRSYRLEVIVRDYQGMNLPVASTLLN